MAEDKDKAKAPARDEREREDFAAALFMRWVSHFRPAEASDAQLHVFAERARAAARVWHETKGGE